MQRTRLFRSFLYVPGLADRIAAGVESAADCVILDLEDMVAAVAKDRARADVAAALGSGLPKPVVVRVNPVGTAALEADLDALAGTGVQAIRVPKVETPDQVGELVAAMERRGVQARLELLIETAPGVAALTSLATAHPRVSRIGLGEVDLARVLGIGSEDGLLTIRSTCVLAAGAAALPPPTLGVWADVADEAGLIRSSHAGRALGFFGRSCIDPAQVGPVNAAFTPDTAEVDRARRIIAAYEEAAARGDGAFVLDDGTFVDLPIADAARRLVDLAASFA